MGIFVSHFTTVGNIFEKLEIVTITDVLLGGMEWRNLWCVPNLENNIEVDEQEKEEHFKVDDDYNAVTHDIQTIISEMFSGLLNIVEGICISHMTPM